MSKKKTKRQQLEERLVEAECMQVFDDVVEEELATLKERQQTLAALDLELQAGKAAMCLLRKAIVQCSNDLDESDETLKMQSRLLDMASRLAWVESDLRVDIEDKMKVLSESTKAEMDESERAALRFNL